MKLYHFLGDASEAIVLSDEPTESVVKDFQEDGETVKVYELRDWDITLPTDRRLVSE